MMSALQRRPPESDEAPPRSALVGVDESLGARIALEHAAERVGRDGRLVLAHVVAPQAPPVTPISPAAPVAVRLRDLEEDRHRIARALVERLAKDVSPRAEARVLEGPVAQALTRLAREEDADELVVGARGLGRFAAAIGSVSHAVLHEADGPVVVIPERALA